MTVRPHRTASLLAACFLAVAACSGGNEVGDGGGIGGTASVPEGTVRLALTDAPACGHDAVYVTIERIRLHQDAAAPDDAAGWQDIVLPAPRRVDLLTLTNGVVTELGEADLPVGRYSQLRLVLVANEAGRAPANAVVPTGGVETPLQTPGARQGGLNLSTAIDVQKEDVTDVVLDFDACRSVVRRGSTGEYDLRPVLASIPVRPGMGQRVSGHVAPALAAGATVSVQFEGRPVKATVPDGMGRFVLYPVPVGTYDLVISAPGRTTAVVTGVPVTADGATRINEASAPITPPAATLAAVGGTVSPAEASVRALKRLAGGPLVETAWVPVEPGSGAFALRLPVEAPVRAVHAPPPATPTFAADAATGTYTLEAREGDRHQRVDIDTRATIAPLHISLP